MILGIGVDTIEIDRFALWHTYSIKKLRRIFSSEEIEYCLENIKKSAERFAVRFAAREALYKALSYAYPDVIPPFLTICKAVTIKKINQKPYVFLHNDLIIPYPISLAIHCSLSHSKTQVTAFIVLERTVQF